MLPLGALMMALSLPIVRVVYERFAFDKDASEFVAAILMAYGLGMFVYLGRDVLVRVFYALGDGQTPFKISAINIVLNAVFDYLLINAFGAPGLVLATFSVNLISMLALLFLLDRKLNGLPLVQWMLPFFNLTIASFIAGTASWGILWGMQQVLGTEGFLIQLLQLCVAGLLGLVIFGAIATQLNLPEVDILVDRVRQKFGNHSGG
jgi:putative peptidoglycan lipid II flippase